MHATHVNDESIDTVQRAILDSDELDLKAFTSNVSTIAGVEADPCPDAHCCGARSCRLEEYLAQVQIDGFGKRVLCPVHLVRLVKREVEEA